MKEFREEQRMNQWWVWVVLVWVVGVWCWDFAHQVWGDKPYTPIGLAISFCIIAAAIALFCIMRLQTHYTSEGISVRYPPFVNKFIPWESIESAELIKYRFVGYGIRFTFRYGTVYNTNGNRGVLIKKKKGGTFLIGTQHPELVQQIIEQYKSR